MAYCTSTEVIERMGLETVGSALLGRVTGAIDAASVAIDNDTGRTFSATTATKLFSIDEYVTSRRFLTGSHGFSDSGYTLSVPDLISITTLKFDDNDDGVYDLTITPSEYELDGLHQTADGWPYDTVRMLNRNFPYGGRRRKRIEIVGSWGFTAVPSPINQACSLLAAQLAQRSMVALFGVQSFGDLGAQAVRTKDPHYMQLISAYQRAAIA